MSNYKLSAPDLEQVCSHVEDTIEAYRPGTGSEEVELAISDLLADLMHYCEEEKVPFSTCLARAQDHYREEGGKAY